jgi:hypothetical protein
MLAEAGDMVAVAEGIAADSSMAFSPHVQRYLGKRIFKNVQFNTMYSNKQA